ncbi:ankyrin repeat domain-containing protein 29, partial [Uranotaenia lowii]|uniref:ankyrin repeat domain-containing protein 29 n=1 Tax=Uranotaenia lowii TaxID=190385 RepID=UPI0024799223
LPQTGTTALFFAAQGGFVDVARILLKAGAPVDCSSVDGGTPLFVACQGGHETMVSELLSHGANVHACMKDRATPLFIAAQNGHGAVLKLLLAAGAHPDNPRNDGATPLWIAAQMGHDHIVKILLMHGAYVDSLRCDGATALFKAAHKGHSSVVHELLKYRPNLGLIQNGESALHAAALFSHLPVVKQLVAAGAEISLKNQENLSALQIARQQKNHGVYQYLKEREHHIRHQSAALGTGGVGVANRTTSTVQAAPSASVGPFAITTSS